ncbi:threonine-phosphate decarboxylase CobD [Brevibacillus dissolubilis]|uniref:threonine-phosphate decarboxylase CobD n=1 Tax=Brevibacillus dissolubilis TaxID=1844116 RepID=UPI001117A88B|nr:threonine-phosphate decarboxylase CobD [Brevibacillus dissolubilis]
MKWIEQYGHGGDIWSAAKTFGTEASDLLDYSANINPLGVPDSLFPALQRALPEIIRYPDPICRNLRAKLAIQYEVAQEQILIGNGAAECIQLAVTALQPERVGIIYPSFSEYEAVASKAGCEIVPHFTEREDAFLPRIEALLNLIKRVDMLFIGHPNNPTGNHLGLEELTAVAEQCRKFDVTLCVDEAFLDFLPDGEELSLLPRLAEFPNVLLFRSMTKIYAIPGLRLGYCIGHPEIIERLSSQKIPWSVNHLAQAAGEILLDEQEYIQKTQAFVTEERIWLKERLTACKSIHVFPSKTNYLLLHVHGLTSYAIQQSMAEKGILIRNCSMYPGLGEGYLRVAVKTRAENERMADTLIQVVRGLREGRPSVLRSAEEGLR